MSYSDARAHRPVVESREVWAGRIFSVASDEVQLSGGTVTREWIDHPGAVAIVALDDDDRVALIRQYRHPVRGELWEIPAGLLDVEGEDYLEAAKRELAEETDLVASEWSVLVDYFCTPGASNESLRIFLARGISDAPEVHEREDEEAE
ncbi:MAG: NUDIX hydrolase, partial [bacterium]|nr:NUDIX hydrolase [bacterium]